jgi:hypothetical protein
VPQIFIDGIVEYHLGLFHEQQRRPAFRERFQTAYGNLRWFIPYSDIARLICAHYLYCANEFAAALTLCERGAGRLRRTLDFFLGNTRATSAETSRSPAGGQQGLSLLMALPDLLTFQAVDALQEGQPEKAVELCSAVHREITSAFDKERAARLAYVEACARAAQAGTEAAQKMFENLSHSPWPSIAEAARKHLPVVAHG